MAEHTITTIRHLLEGDARVDASIRAFKAVSNSTNLYKMLRTLRTYDRALHLIGNWRPPSSSLLFLDTNNVLRFQNDYNPKIKTNSTMPMERVELVLWSVLYRPTTQGLNSRMTTKEANAHVKENERKLPYRDLVPIPMPAHLMDHYS